VRETRSGKVGVIGTAGTVSSGAYPRAIAALAPEVEVFAQPCPLFVPLAEEGWITGAVPKAIAETYLAGLLAVEVDTLVLGCTHYPLLKETLHKVTGPAVTLVDSAAETAKAVNQVLVQEDLAAATGGTPRYAFLATDAPDTLARTGERFLGRALGPVQWVDVTECQLRTP